MARRTTEDQEATGADSFLDVITNIVGILIVLVMVVGKHASDSMANPEPVPSNHELVAVRDEALSIEREVHELQARMLGVQQEMQLRTLERSQLQTLVTAIERELESKQQTLGEAANTQYTVNRDLAIARDALARMKAELELIENAPARQTVQIKSYPTPLGVTVHGKEVFLQLRNGRLTVVPLEVLMTRLKGALRNKISGTLGANPELTGTIGPYDGFRIRYRLDRRLTPEGPSYSFATIEFVPVSNQLGEPVEQALKAGSEFRTAIGQMSPDLYTVTLWTAADSFSEYARLKQMLCEMGFQVAGWPLENGEAIGMSPYGRASTAQ